MEDRQAYDTDLTDAEWDRLEPLVPAAKPGGRPPKHTRREIVNGICCAIRSGAHGNCCPTICPLGVRPIITFGPGAGRGSGSESMTPCATGCDRRPDERANPVARCWTASRCGPVNKGACVAMMGPRNYAGASVTCW